MNFQEMMKTEISSIIVRTKIEKNYGLRTPSTSKTQILATERVHRAEEDLSFTVEYEYASCSRVAVGGEVAPGQAGGHRVLR
jgi:hypothetical protein